MTIYVPDYILREVLSRLPVKSLLRFRSVSKSWLSLISCTDFAELQFKRASSCPKIMELCWKNTLKSISFDGLPESQMFALPFFNGSSRGRILGSVNGLLCVCSREYDSFHIYNPCTNQHRDIPALIFPQHSQVHFYGFGYDSTTDDYKLLIVTLFREEPSENSGNAMISLFSLRRGTWRSFLEANAMISLFYLRRGTWRNFLEGNYLPNYFDGDRCGTCLNDGIHWSFIEDTDSGTRPVIVCFGLVEESFSIIHVPDLCQIGFNLYVWSRCHLSVLDGCLCLSIKPCPPLYASLYPLITWMMKEYGVYSSWTELMSTEYSHNVINYIRPLCSTGGGGEILYQYNCCNLASFNTRTKTFKIHPGCYNNMYSVNPTVHVESLISPNAIKLDMRSEEEAV